MEIAGRLLEQAELRVPPRGKSGEKSGDFVGRHGFQTRFDALSGCLVVLATMGYGCK